MVTQRRGLGGWGLKIGAWERAVIEKYAKIDANIVLRYGLGACRTCRFFSLHPTGSGQKTFDKWAPRTFGSMAVCMVKNRLIGDFS
jgi:hypothetical protein